VYDIAVSNIVETSIIPTLSCLHRDERLRNILRFPFRNDIIISFHDLAFVEGLLNRFRTKYVLYESICVQSNILS